MMALDVSGYIEFFDNGHNKIKNKVTSFAMNIFSINI